MLVLSRRVGQRIFISGGIVVTVLSVDRGKIRLGFSAPEGVDIIRDDAKERRAVKPVVKL